MTAREPELCFYLMGKVFKLRKDLFEKYGSFRLYDYGAEKIVTDFADKLVQEFDNSFGYRVRVKLIDMIEQTSTYVEFEKKLEKSELSAIATYINEWMENEWIKEIANKKSR